MAEGGAEDGSENPFSFKKFVKKKTSPEEETQPEVKENGEKADGSENEFDAAAKPSDKGDVSTEVVRLGAICSCLTELWTVSSLWMQFCTERVSSFSAFKR